MSRMRRPPRKGAEMDKPADALPAPETLFTAAIYLVTNYVKSGCPMLCHMVTRQLAYIQNHPSAGVTQDVRDACARLSDEWERIGIERAELMREVASARAGNVQPLH